MPPSTCLLNTWNLILAPLLEGEFHLQKKHDQMFALRSHCHVTLLCVERHDQVSGIKNKTVCVETHREKVSFKNAY